MDYEKTGRLIKKKRSALNLPQAQLNDCRELLLPLINEVFGEHYTGEERIVFSSNEHFLNRENGGENERITDTSFLVIGRKGAKRYHWECQATTDHSLILRLFEYDSQIALDEDGELKGDKLCVSFPNTAVLYLRSSSVRKDHMTVEIVTPGGTVSYKIPVVRMQSYSLSEIFNRNLLFLIPFYIFNREKELPECDENTEKRKQLAEEFAYIRKELEYRAEKKLITEYQKRAIIEMTAKVIANLASQYQRVSKEVGGIMMGKTLDYEAKRILDEGIRQGKEQGIEQGIEKGITIGADRMIISMVRGKVLMGKGLLEITNDLGLSPEEIALYYNATVANSPDYKIEDIEKSLKELRCG